MRIETWIIALMLATALPAATAQVKNVEATDETAIRKVLDA